MSIRVLLRRLMTIVLSLMVYGCSHKESPEYLPLAFTVNQELLGTPFTGDPSEIIFSPPALCKPIGEETLARARSRVSGLYDDTYVTYNLERFFMDSTARNFCSYSRVTFSGAGDSIDVIDRHVTEFLAKQFSSSDIIRGKVLINTIKALQYRIVSETHVIYKIFLFSADTGSVVQIDYALSRPVSGRWIEYIQSSIGSIRKSMNGGRENL